MSPKKKEGIGHLLLQVARLENIQRLFKLNFQTTGVPSIADYTTIETVSGQPALVSTLRPLYESEVTTSQVGAKYININGQCNIELIV